jgi:hypothetical protein
MKSQIQSENTSLSNKEISVLLGQKCKLVSPKEKAQYKKQSQLLQEEFKRKN